MENVVLVLLVAVVGVGVGTPTATWTGTGTGTVTETVSVSVTVRSPTATESPSGTSTGSLTETFTIPTPSATVSYTLPTPTTTPSGSETLPTPTGTGTVNRTTPLTPTPTPTYTATLPTGTGTATPPTHTTSMTVTLTVSTTMTLPTPTHLPTLTPTHTHTASMTITLPTPTPPITPTPTPTHTASITMTLPTLTPPITPTPTLTPAPSATTTSTATPSPSPTHTVSATQSATDTQSVTVTSSHSPTTTGTLRTATDTWTATATATVTSTSSDTGTGTATRSATQTVTGTATPSVTGTSTESYSQSFTRSVSESVTLPTPTATFTATRSTSASSTATASHTPSYTVTETATFMCPEGQINIDTVCLTKGVVTFSLRYVFTTLEAAQAVGEQAVSEAMCSDLVRGEGLTASEVCTVEGLSNGSLVGELRVETSTGRAQGIGEQITTKAAGGSLRTVDVQRLLGGEVVVDPAAFVDPMLDGVSMGIITACTADNCNNHGTPSGNRPACTCVCTDNWLGDDCSTPPLTGVPPTLIPTTPIPETLSPPPTNPDCAVAAASYVCGSGGFDVYTTCEQRRCECLSAEYWPSINECVPGVGVTCNLILTCQDEFDGCMDANSGGYSCKEFRRRCCTDLASRNNCEETCAVSDDDESGLALLYIILIIVGACLCIVFLICFIRAYQKDREPKKTEEEEEPPRRPQHETPAALRRNDVIGNEPYGVKVYPSTQRHGHYPDDEEVVGRGVGAGEAPPPDMATPGGESGVTRGTDEDGMMVPDYGSTTEDYQPSQRFETPEKSSVEKPTTSGGGGGGIGRGKPFVVSHNTKTMPHNPQRSSLKSPTKEVVVVPPEEEEGVAPEDIVKFFDGRKQRLVTVIGLDEGRACYSLEGVRRPPFTYVEYKGEVLRVPELQRSMILPSAKLQREATLLDLRDLFDRCFVKHDIPDRDHLESPMGTPSPGLVYPGVYDSASRAGSPEPPGSVLDISSFTRPPMPVEWGHPPPSARQRVLTPVSPSVASRTSNAVWGDPHPHQLPPPCPTVSYVEAGRVSPAAVQPYPDNFTHALDTGLQALSRRPDWNPDYSHPRGTSPRRDYN